MDSSDIEDNHMESEQRTKLTHRSDRKDKAPSRKWKKTPYEDNESSVEIRARTRKRERILDPYKDRISDGDQSHASIYSDNFENTSQSDRSFSPRSPSPSAYRGATTYRESSSPVPPKGVRKGIPRRPGLPPQPLKQRFSSLRSQYSSKDASPKELDLVTKRLLSARLLKISELKNIVGEQQLRIDELQRENRLLKQLQLRHEKALHRYGDTENEISQLLSQHKNETHNLQERLRRSQEKERIAERRCTEANAQLQHCEKQLRKMQKLVDNQHLGERDELARKLGHAQVKVEESERKVKELEKNVELSTGSFQRQLASERKKTHDALQETQMLREEMAKLSVKLKEKERELDARNIYANRMLRGASKKDLEDSSRRKGAIRSSSKAVQTEDSQTLSVDFPSPPLAITNGSAFSRNNQTVDYLSVKEEQRSELRQTEAQDERFPETAREQVEDRGWGIEKEEQEMEKEALREIEREIAEEKEKLRKQRMHFEYNWNKARQTDGWDREEEDRKSHERLTEEEKGKNLEPRLSEKEIQANQEHAAEERRRKELLLAKMREIEMQAQTQDPGFFHDKTGSTQTPPRNQNASIFSFSDPQEYLSTPKTEERGGPLTSQKTNQDVDLIFGSYAPSFGKPAPRAGFGRRSPTQSVAQLSGDENDQLDLSMFAKEKKPNLMQQLFGSSTSSVLHESPNKMELLSSPSTRSPSNRRRREEDTPNKMKRTTLHVSESGLAVRAITGLDEDIEEITL